jgi:hypothetical protein
MAAGATTCNELKCSNNNNDQSRNHEFRFISDTGDGFSRASRTGGGAVYTVFFPIGRVEMRAQNPGRIQETRKRSADSLVRADFI